MDPYERLASAIVAQAEKDYINYHKKIKQCNDNINKIIDNITKYNLEPSMHKIEEIERKISRFRSEIDEIVYFFKSAWFRTLSDRDPENVLKKLEEKINGG